MKEGLGITRDELFNSDISIECFEISGPGVNRLHTLFSLYDGDRYAENYTTEVLDQLIADNRFFSALELKLNHETVAFCCLSNRNGWVVISRFVRLKYYRLPFVFGIIIPYIERNLEPDNKGIVMTFNDSNKVLFDMIGWNERRWKKMKSLSDVLDHEIFVNATDTVSRTHKLECMVEHNYTMQWVAYISKDNLTKPFN